MWAGVQIAATVLVVSVAVTLGIASGRFSQLVWIPSAGDGDDETSMPLCQFYS